MCKPVATCQGRVHGRATRYIVSVDRGAFLARMVQQIAGELGATAGDRDYAATALAQQAQG